MLDFPDGFNTWDKEVQLRYIDAAVAASEVKKMELISEVKKMELTSEVRKMELTSEVRKMELTVQLETLKLKRPSIGKGDAVFIFYIAHEGFLEVSGTAFAISETLIFTAYHNFSIDGGDHHPNCSISSKATNTSGVLTPLDDCISLKLLCFDKCDDWALFCRHDTGVFSTFLPICQKEELPKPSSDVIIHQYYFSLGLILNSTIKDLCIWSDSTSLLQYDDGKFAILKRGKTSGSSGSPAVTNDGKVLGMHLDSFTESPECIFSNADGNPDSPPPPPLAKMGVSKRRLSEEGAAERSSCVMESTSVFSSLSDLSHSSYSRVLVLAAVPQLMEAIQKARAGHS